MARMMKRLKARSASRASPAFSHKTIQADFGVGAVMRMGQGNPIKGGVEAPIATAAESVAYQASRGGFEGCYPLHMQQSASHWQTGDLAQGYQPGHQP